MTEQEAKEIVNIGEAAFDIEDTHFGDGSVSISIARVFDTKEAAEKYVEALRV